MHVVSVYSYVLTAGRLIAPVIERSGAVAGFDWCMEALTAAQHSGLASEVALAKAAWSSTIKPLATLYQSSRLFLAAVVLSCSDSTSMPGVCWLAQSRA